MQRVLYCLHEILINRLDIYFVKDEIHLKNNSDTVQGERGILCRGIKKKLRFNSNDK